MKRNAGDKVTITKEESKLGNVFQKEWAGKEMTIEKVFRNTDSELDEHVCSLLNTTEYYHLKEDVNIANNYPGSLWTDKHFV